MFRKVHNLLILFLIMTLALPVRSARAQGTAFVNLFPPDASQFPQITALLDVFDDQGAFIRGLTSAEVAIVEDGQTLTPEALEELEIPLAITVAINAGPALAVRDGLGISRYDKMLAVLKNWALARPVESDDNFALTWNGGIIGSQITPGEWFVRAEGFDPALRNSTAGLTALAFGLDATQQAPAPPGGKKALLFISPHLENRDIPGLPDLANRARQANIRIFVWMCDSSAYTTSPSPSAQALQDLATQTGGRFLTFTGTETLPDPEEWIASLRYVYRFSYASAVRAAGNHNLNAQVTTRELALTSNTASFQLDIQPPSPTLLSPPIQIIRQNSESPFDLETFEPKSQAIAALVEFPDEVKRSLVRTTLYVDGEIADENTTPPFDKFTWDVSIYQATGEHTLQIEAEDSLGLVGKSEAVPVDVTVIQPPGGTAGLILRNRMAITMSAIILAGLVLLGILFFGGRKTLSVLAERRRMRVRNLDPVTQPVRATLEAPGTARPSTFPWLRRKAPAPVAYLVKLTFDGQPAAGDPIPLTGHELTFGTDPTQATHVLDHPSLSPLHARLRQGEEGGFVLLDQNSIAGTWVNYTPPDKAGCSLRHGDVIHFGHLSYRFVLTKPPAAQKPVITPLSTDDSH